MPIEIRRTLGLKAGDKLACNMLSIGTVVFRPKTHTLADVAGMLARPDQAVPVERISPATELALNPFDSRAADGHSWPNFGLDFGCEAAGP